jgi:hypothetical protein
VPTCRVRTSDRRTLTVTAGRVVVADDQVRFQSSDGAGWTAVEVVPLHCVATVQRRVNEANGSLRWVSERTSTARSAARTTT